MRALSYSVRACRHPQRPAAGFGLILAVPRVGGRVEATSGRGLLNEDVDRRRVHRPGPGPVAGGHGPEGRAVGDGSGGEPVLECGHGAPGGHPGRGEDGQLGPVAGLVGLGQRSGPRRFPTPTGTWRPAVGPTVPSCRSPRRGTTRRRSGHPRFGRSAMLSWARFWWRCSWPGPTKARYRAEETSRTPGSAHLDRGVATSAVGGRENWERQVGLVPL